MENASKALIIAGSILLAVLIIAMGVTIFNKARGAASTENLDAAEINMFNQKFDKYITGNSGSGIMGSQVKTLLSSAISNANTNQDEPSKLPAIELVGGTTITGGQTAEGSGLQNYINAISSMRNDIISKSNYKVIADYGTSGLITKIIIEQI